MTAASRSAREREPVRLARNVIVTTGKPTPDRKPAPLARRRDPFHDHRAPVTARTGLVRCHPMISATTDLDVVVLGGGGHVGLPLSLTLAQEGLCVGILDINQGTLDRIAAGEMPFMENG